MQNRKKNTRKNQHIILIVYIRKFVYRPNSENAHKWYIHCICEKTHWRKNLIYACIYMHVQQKCYHSLEYRDGKSVRNFNNKRF